MINEKDVKAGNRYKLATNEIVEVLKVYNGFYPRTKNLYVEVKFIKADKKFMGKKYELVLQDFCHLNMINEI